MRYAGLYARSYQDVSTQKWLIANAFHAYNNLNSMSYGHSAWLTKASENGMYNDVDYTSAGSAFGASTALSAACGVPVDHYYGDDTAIHPHTIRDEKACQQDSRSFLLSGHQVKHPRSGQLIIRGGKKYIVR